MLIGVASVYSSALLLKDLRDRAKSSSYGISPLVHLIIASSILAELPY